MKKFLVILLILSVGFVACKKNAENTEDTSTMGDEGTVPTALGFRYASLAISIRETEDLSSKSAGYLTKIEEVELLEELQGKNSKGQNVLVNKVKRKSGDIGFQEARYFGIKAVAVSGDSVEVYSSNSDTATIVKNLPKGTVFSIVEQMGEYYKIIAYNLPDKENEVWEKWISSSAPITESRDDVVDYYKLEYIKYNLYRLAKEDPSQKEKLTKRMTPEIKALQKSNNDFILSQANEILAEIEGGGINNEESESDDMQDQEEQEEDFED